MSALPIRVAFEDNSYFRDLLKKTWTKATAKNSKTQYVSGKTMMLPTDMVLIEDAKFKPPLGRKHRYNMIQSHLLYIILVEIVI